MIRQRVFQIARGYEDQDDADTLRTDPLLNFVYRRLSETGDNLASQAILCRLANAANRKVRYRLAVALFMVYAAQRECTDAPRRLLFDVDAAQRGRPVTRSP